MPREHVADASDLAVGTAARGEPFERERRPGTVSEKMFKAPKIAGHIAVDERDPDTGVRRGVAGCLISSRHEDAVGDAGVEVHMMVERRTEAVQKGDATEPRAGGCRDVGVARDACRSA
jgi:hypothetical protein